MWLLLSLLTSSHVYATCPSPSFTDPSPSAPFPYVPTVEAHTWTGENPPVTLSSASTIVTLPHMSSSGVANNANQTVNCPHLASGLSNWHDPSIWPQNTIPNANGSSFSLPANTHVLVSSCSLDDMGIYGAITIPSTSSLVFADAQITLHTTGIQVDGQLHAGSPTCRIRGPLDITLHGTRSLGEGAVYKGIVGKNLVSMHGALYHPTWTRLAAGVSAGDTELILQDCVNWEAGQTIVITTSQFRDSRDFNKNDEATISTVQCVSVEGYGNLGRVTVSSALSHSHYAGMGSYQAEVGLLSRSIIIQGDSSSEPTDTTPLSCTDGSQNFVESFPCDNTFLTGFGGHVIISGGVGRVSAVEFYRMGQTNVLGRYPMHFHLLGDTEGASYANDISVHHSFFRGIVLHGTNDAFVQRSVMYDVIGNALYLEAGVEENNTIAFNLGAHVHTVGKPIIANGQNLDDIESSADLLVPADKAAAPFYISNAYNRLVGNAASGGWVGFSFVGFPSPIEEFRNDSLEPNTRPILEFDGNTIHSCSFFWNLGGGIYFGGNLYYKNSGTTLVYNAGRDVSRTRKPIDDDGNDAWLVLTNTKVALVSVAVTDWAVRSEHRYHEAYDIQDRSFNVFGDVWLDNVRVTCRSDNTLVVDSGTGKYDKAFSAAEYAGFRSYDTGQRHILTNWTFSNCSHTSGNVFVWPIGVNVPQAQIKTQDIRFLDASYSNMFGFDVGQVDRFGWSFHGLQDVDGSFFGRAVPMIGGSADYPAEKLSSAGQAGDHTSRYWWTLDRDGCEYIPGDWPMIACEQNNRQLGYLELKHHPTKNENSDFFNQPSGGVVHFGQRLNESNIISFDPGFAGPFNHDEYGGWYVWLHHGAPKEIVISRIQLPRERRRVLVALSYPIGTSFTVTAAVSGSCNPAAKLCSHTFTPVGSVAAVRSGNGDVYHFDGSHLYIAVVQNGPSELGDKNAINRQEWSIDAYDIDAMDFKRAGLSIPARSPAKYTLTISADCTAGSDSHYCDVTRAVPEMGCPSGFTVTGIDTCTAPSPSQSPGPSLSTSHSVSLSPNPGVIVVASNSPSLSQSSSHSSSSSSSQSSSTSSTPSPTPSNLPSDTIVTQIGDRYRIVLRLGALTRSDITPELRLRIRTAVARAFGVPLGRVSLRVEAKSLLPTQYSKEIGTTFEVTVETNPSVPRPAMPNANTVERNLENELSALTTGEITVQSITPVSDTSDSEGGGGSDTLIVAAVCGTAGACAALVGLAAFTRHRSRRSQDPKLMRTVTGAAILVASPELRQRVDAAKF